MAIDNFQMENLNPMFEKQKDAALERFLDRTNERKRVTRELETKTPLEVDTAQRIEVRKSSIDSRDGLSFERLVGNSDIFPVSYFEAGLIISRSVCRIEMHDRVGRVTGYGTGFMVSPKLLMTNNHVLETIEKARYSLAQFDYQTDLNLLPRPVKSFRFDPDKFFITDKRLDFTLTAVEEFTSGGDKLSQFGFLRLIFESGKALIGEYVTIVQHPSGGPKSVVIRENRVVDIFDDFIHYAADTSEGSSGSAVFNDNWDVVAVHHASIPDPENNRSFVANEGVRISSICRFIASAAVNLSASEQEILGEFLSDSPCKAIIPDQLTMITEEAEIETYKQMQGYDESFLGESHIVKLPEPGRSIKNDILLFSDGNAVLNYTHFSIVMSRSRKLAFYSAVNINGKELVSLKRNSDKWYYDPRIERRFQSGPEVYKNNDLDRGHLVRRIDPVWGKGAAEANENTFHFTNCVPQHKNLNQKIWSNLEDYILRNAQEHDLKVTVFTGPVFRADDILYRGLVQIPAEFWKIAVMVKKDGVLRAAAYLQTQKNLITDLEFAYGKYKTYQVSIEKIESLTDLHFGSLRDKDPLVKVKTGFAELISRPEDLIW